MASEFLSLTAFRLSPFNDSLICRHARRVDLVGDPPRSQCGRGQHDEEERRDADLFVQGVQTLAPAQLFRIEPDRQAMRCEFLNETRNTCSIFAGVADEDIPRSCLWRARRLHVAFHATEAGQAKNLRNRVMGYHFRWRLGTTLKSATPIQVGRVFHLTGAHENFLT